MVTSPRPRLPAAVVATTVVAAMLVGCSTGGTAEDPTTSTAADRIEAIRTAREAVVRPAQDLGTAAAQVAADLDALVQDLGEPEITAVRTAVEDLDGARSAVGELELEPSTDDVAAAAGSLEDASAGADQLERAAEDVAGTADEALAVAEALDEIVAAWDEPGSRSQLMARFEELAAQAEGLAERAPPQACSGPVEEAIDAATFVAEATRELRSLVAQYDGNGFDARREELHDAPYGTTEDGDTRAPGTSLEGDTCPAIADARTAASDVATALRELQQALNPSDLES